MQPHTWHVKIHRSYLGNVTSIMASFRRSGFVVKSLGNTSYSWTYSLQHHNKHAMTLYMLTHDCRGFTVTLEEIL
jgi:hypothetical protein